MKLAELRKAAKEAKEELGFEEINTKAKEAELKKELTEVALLIGAEGEDAITEDELDDVSPRTKEILMQLKEDASEDNPEAEPVKEKKKGKKAKAKKQAEPEPEEEEEDTDENELVDKIKEADLAELKAIIKAEGKDVFPVSVKGLFLQKNEEKLRIKALKDLGEEVEEEEKPVVKEKKAKTNKPKGVGVIATIVEAVETAGAKGITRDQVHAILVKKFPEREASSLMNTVKVQLPSRINKERFEIKTLKDGKYAKA